MRRLALLGVLTFALTACGGLGTVSFGSTIGPDGGLVTSGDGKARAEIPPGALDKDTEVTLESDGDGGYVLGPEDAEFDEPVTVAIDGDEPAAPVRVGEDGTEEPLDDPTVSSGPGVTTTGGTLTEPGRISLGAPHTTVDVAPTYLTVGAGRSFTATAAITMLAGSDGDGDTHAERLAAAVAAGQGGAVPTGQEILHQAATEHDGAPALSATLQLGFVCEGPGRWSFGADVPLADGRTLHWHTGTVDCVADEEAEGHASRIGDPEVTEPEGPPPGEDERSDEDLLMEYLLGLPGTAGFADDSVALHLAPLEVSAVVGEQFEAALDVWDVRTRHTTQGQQAVVRVEMRSPGPVAEPTLGVREFPIADDVPIMGIPLFFVCAEEGAQSFGAHVTMDYSAAGGGTFEIEHLVGEVTCTDEADPVRHLSIADAGTWYPGGYVGTDGISVRLHPAAFVAKPGQTVTVNVEVGLPGDPAAPYWRNATASGIVGEGDAVTTDPDRIFGGNVPSPGTVQLPIKFTCVKEGVQAIGTRLFLNGNHQDEKRNDTGATSPEVYVQMLLGTGVCTSDVTGALPGSDWMGQFGTSAEGQEASLPGTLQGPCQGRAAIDGYGTIDPRASGGVYKVPRKGSAKWFGAIAAVPGEERSHNGQVVVHLPPPFPAVKVGEWADTTTEVHNSGEGSWDLNPQWTPGGVLVAVSGEHNDTAGNCRAKVLVRIDGGPLDSAAGPASLAFTLFALGIFGWAGLPKPS